MGDRSLRRFRTFLTAAAVAAIGAAGVGAAAPGTAGESGLGGRWVLNEALTREVQPEVRERRSLFDDMPRATVSVGGVPLPRAGTPPPTGGSAPDPKVLRTRELVIEPQGDGAQARLHLAYGNAGSETLKRGNHQGLISRWSDDRLTSRYQTTSRKVSQVFEIRDDGRLLVTVKLDPNRGPTLIHKRVFDRAP